MKREPDNDAGSKASGGAGSSTSGGASGDASSGTSGPAAGGARETILREAATLFATKGYAESGLREIADKAGMRASSVYHHFSSKEQIYEEIIRIAVERTAQAVRAELASLPADANVRQRFEAALRGHLHALHSNKPFTSTNAHSRIKLPHEVDAVIGKMRAAYAGFWRALIDEAQAVGALRPGVDPKLLRPLVLESLNRTVGWFDARHGSLESLSATLVTMFAGIWAETPVVADPPAPRSVPAKRARARRS